MYIYLHADTGLHLDQDMMRMNTLNTSVLRPMHLAIGHKSIDDVVLMLTRRDVTTLILPDQYTRHTEDMERVKQIAHLMDRDVMPLTHFLRKRAQKQALNATANPSANGWPATPSIAGGNATQATA